QRRTVVLVAIGVVGAIVLFVAGNYLEERWNPTVKMTTIGADVSFTGTQIALRNPTAYNWTDVLIELNFSSAAAFKYRLDSLRAGESTNIGAALFARDDGTRFNPFALKPQQVAVTAHLSNGETGSYVGEWR